MSSRQYLVTDQDVWSPTRSRNGRQFADVLPDLESRFTYVLGLFEFLFRVREQVNDYCQNEDERGYEHEAVYCSNNGANSFEPVRGLRNVTSIERHPNGGEQAGQNDEKQDNNQDRT